MSGRHETPAVGQSVMSGLGGGQPCRGNPGLAASTRGLQRPRTSVASTASLLLLHQPMLGTNWTELKQNYSETRIPGPCRQRRVFYQAFLFHFWGMVQNVLKNSLYVYVYCVPVRDCVGVVALSWKFFRWDWQDGAQNLAVWQLLLI